MNHHYQLDFEEKLIFKLLFNIKNGLFQQHRNMCLCLHLTFICSCMAIVPPGPSAA